MAALVLLAPEPDRPLSARVETGYVDDDFTRNLVTILAEERLAFAVKRPSALIYGDFGRVA